MEEKRFKLVTYHHGKVLSEVFTDSIEEVKRIYSPSFNGIVAVRVWDKGRKLKYIESNRRFDTKTRPM